MSGPVVSGSHAVSARVELGPGQEQTSLGTIVEYGGYNITVYASPGWVWIARAVGKPAEWKRLAQAEVGIRQGTPFELRIEVRPGKLDVFVDGKPACSCEHDLREPGGNVSLHSWDRMVWLEAFAITPLDDAR